MEEELLESSRNENTCELGVRLEQRKGVDCFEGDGADISLREDARLLDGSVGLVGVEVLAPELNAAFYGVKVLVCLLVDMREDTRAARAASIGVENAKGIA